jgi:tetratricopeptide (TPR) repeat protein
VSGFRHGSAFEWRIERSLEGVRGESLLRSTANDMADELAYRVFTNLALGRTAQWTATRCFARGIEAYRDSLKSRRDRAKRLVQAEGMFLEATAEDQRFDLAFHNLGVVYFERGELYAAERAFRKAVEINPHRLESYYALAIIDEMGGRQDLALWRCERILQGKSDPAREAQAAHLTAVVHLTRRSPRKALRHARRAARKGRRTLRRRYLTPWRDQGERSVRGIEEELALYFYNLAKAHLALGEEQDTGWHQHRARGLLRNSIRLAPGHAAPRTALAGLMPPKRRVLALRMASQLAGGNSSLWAWLGVTHAQLQEREEAEAACSQALANPSQVAIGAAENGDLRATIEGVARTYELLGESDAAERVRRMPTLMADLRASSTEDERAEVEARLESGDWTGDGWARAQVLLTLLSGATDLEPRKARARLTEAISLLEEADAHEEVTARGLRGELARRLMLENDSANALAQAEHAVHVDPINPYERSIIGTVYAQLAEWPAARDAYEKALLQNPEEPTGHLQLASVLLQLADNSRDVAERDRLLHEAHEHSERALAFLGAQATSDKSDARLLLCWVAYRRGNYEDAIAHGLVSHNLSSTRPTPVLMLGDLYRQRRRFVESEIKYHLALQLGGRPDDGANGAERADAALYEVVDSIQATPVLRGEVLARASIGLAETRLERLVSFGEARALLRKARRVGSSRLRAWAASRGRTPWRATSRRVSRVSRTPQRSIRIRSCTSAGRGCSRCWEGQTRASGKARTSAPGSGLCSPGTWTRSTPSASESMRCSNGCRAPALPDDASTR